MPRNGPLRANPVTDPNTPQSLPPELPDSLFGDLVDAVLGESPGKRPAAAVGQEAGIALVRSELDALLGAERSRFAEEEAAAAADGPRLAHFLTARAREDEAAHRAVGRARSRRSRWGRILAISVGAHALLLGFVVWNINRPTTPSEQTPRLVGAFDTHREAPDPSLSDAIAQALAELETMQIAKLPDAVLVFDEAGSEDNPVPDEVMALALQGASKSAVYEWPRGMALSLARRRSAVLKQGRLRALGYDSGPTLDGVERGLRYLASRQEENGNFPSSGGADVRASTAVALLPFLGDGHFSLAADDTRETRLVSSGLACLRTSVFDGAQLREDIDDKVLRPVVIALSEDYMLGYGRLLVKDATVRGYQIRTLVAHLRADESLLGTEDAFWAHWALDAAARTGVVASLPDEEHGYATWRSALANGPS